MTLIDKIVDEALKIHSETVIWCRHCDAKWVIIVPYTFVLTEETNDKQKLFKDLHRNVCPRCRKVMSELDLIKYRIRLTDDFEEVCDRPWIKETC